MSTLEVDLEKWLKLRPVADENRVPRIFWRRSRAVPVILKGVEKWLEEDANTNGATLITGPESNKGQMREYMERGCVHLQKIKRRMIDAGVWEEMESDG